MQDYYEILGISKAANKADIKAAYKKMAMQYHPDRNQGNQNAEDVFKKVNEAYQVLSDDIKKSYYDYGFAVYQAYNQNHYATPENQTYTHPPQPSHTYTKKQSKKDFISPALQKKIIVGTVAFFILVVILGLYFKKKADQWSAQYYYQEAVALAKEEQNQAALIKLSDALAFNEQLYDIYVLRADIYTRKYNYYRAIQDYDLAIRYTLPSKADLFYKRAICYYHLFDFDQAIVDLNQAILLNPHQEIYYFYRGISKIRAEEKFDDFCQDLEKVKKMKEKEKSFWASHYCK
jgi:tetratricopeptide (TPR) repeat protein